MSESKALCFIVSGLAMFSYICVKPWRLSIFCITSMMVVPFLNSLSVLDDKYKKSVNQISVNNFLKNAKNSK